MHAIGELIGYFVLEGLSVAPFQTARIVLLTLSLGLIRVQGSPGSPYTGEPEFGWHNIIWKWDGRRLWVSSAAAYFLGLFLWGCLLAWLLYYWRSLG
jgi:hypothetical protein